MITKEFSFRGNAFKVSCFDHFPQHGSWWSFVDESQLRDKFWNINSGDIVLDIGAAYGSYTMTALVSGASHVYAWSPQHLPGEESERETLLRTLALNGWQDKATVYGTGIYDRLGWLDLGNGEFYESEPRDDAEFVKSQPIRTKPWMPDEMKPGDTWLIKKVETLDSWAQRENPGRIDFIKLDVEGAEVHVLCGAKNMIQRYKPKLLVEYHLYMDPTIKERFEKSAFDIGYSKTESIKRDDSVTFGYFE